MFKVNNQPNLFSFESQLLDKEQSVLLGKTPEKAFYNLIFSNIKENDYRVLLVSKRVKTMHFSASRFSF